LIRIIQNARKNAGFNVDDRIHLRLKSSSKEVNKAIDQFKDTIYAETLTTGELTGEGGHAESATIEGKEAKIFLKKV
jgi:isoleucyl-tRNA synthetase